MYSLNWVTLFYFSGFLFRSGIGVIAKVSIFSFVLFLVEAFLKYYRVVFKTNTFFVKCYLNSIYYSILVVNS
jgi:hypothetical protein